MTYLSLAWQVPALFTAVPMVARLLPVKLPERAIPLLYVVVALIVFALPAEVCLAMGAAGVVSMVHVRLGENLTAIDPPGYARGREQAGAGVGPAGPGLRLPAGRCTTWR